MPDGNDIKDKIKVHERLARMEAILEAIQESIENQRECDEKQDEKLDKILNNDINKLQRIAKTEEKVKNIKATLWIFAVPLAAAVVRSFFL